MHINRAIEYVMADEMAYRSSLPTKLIYMEWKKNKLVEFDRTPSGVDTKARAWHPTPDDLMADDWEYYPCQCPIYQEFLDEDAKRNQNT